MTVNELEQALRNLIASQPVVTSGPSGDFINSALSIVYSYREFLFKVQNHPFQDALKFNMVNTSQKLESDLVISICGVMQERGINLMLYAPSNQYGAGVMQPNFQGQMNPMQNVGMNPMMYNGGQMNSFNQMNVPPQMMGQIPPQGYAAQPNAAAVPTYAYTEEQPKPAAQPKAAPSKKTAPAFSKATSSAKSAPVKAAAPKPKEEVIKNVETPEEIVTEEPKPETSQAPEAVNEFLGEYQNAAPDGKAAGRDYLLELLKK